MIVQTMLTIPGPPYGAAWAAANARDVIGARQPRLIP